MIKFFRHIRKSLLEKNHMGTYFKYALGEIILVVIGILIALWINNLNIERQQQNEAKSLIGGLKKELLENKEVLEIRKSRLKTITKNYSKVLNYSAGAHPTASIDSIKHSIKETLTFGIANIRDSRITSARSSGKFSLLSDEISTAFAEYENTLFNYRKYIDSTSFFDDIWFEVAVRVNTTEELHDYYFDDLDLSLHPEYSGVKDFEEFIKDHKTYKILYQFYTQRIVEIAWVENILSRIDQTLQKTES